MNTGRRQEGTSLVETTIALALGVVLTAAVAVAYVQSRASAQQLRQSAMLEEHAHAALRALVDDLAQAGVVDPRDRPPATECGPVQQPVPRALQLLDGPVAADAVGRLPCLRDVALQPGSDVLAIRRPLPADDPSAAGRSIARIWYVAAAPDRTAAPRLCFAERRGGTLHEDCVAAGVEQLDVHFGIDDDGNGVPDRYSAQPTPAALDQAVSARVSLLLRADHAAPKSAPSPGFHINGRLYQPADGRHRRLYERLVILHNLPATARGD